MIVINRQTLAGHCEREVNVITNDVIPYGLVQGPRGCLDEEIRSNYMRRIIEFASAHSDRSYLTAGEL